MHQGSTFKGAWNFRRFVRSDADWETFCLQSSYALDEQQNRKTVQWNKISVIFLSNLNIRTNWFGRPLIFTSFLCSPILFFNGCACPALN